jgi:hypothetical protein
MDTYDRYPRPFARLPEGDWPWCPCCWDEVDPTHADVQTICNKLNVITQILVHPWCNWYKGGEN